MKKHESAYGLGIISIFLIFAVLFLTVFATLAVSSARADYRLSVKNADYVKKYYMATAECAEFVQQAEAAYSDEVPTAVSSGNIEGDRIKYDMTFNIDENSGLHAVFYIAGSGCEFTTFEITTYVIGSESTGEQTVNVWQP
ncbi:MAG TPA: hypothetical protein PK629_08190 [Oscillospiraceae bacterium]|nr:hypothetical protein [Oscillospiraceae bacterium]HPF55817.1 hypothetical protein [Clostridiales bacterium]HPK35438.1 hypothetical protein [Oscillospiraceae bacterium]HPR75162.1 hypothetical protein [Oscillospiraceae bacterium]